jgi:hypothetical protein
VDNALSATVYVVLTDCPLVRLLFQKGDLPPFQSFNIGVFVFLTVNAAEEIDSFSYIVSHAGHNFGRYIIFRGVDTTVDTAPTSNVDVVYFTWRYLKRFSFVKRGLVNHPSDDLFHTTPRLLTLRHYRATRDGWNDSGDCDLCVEIYQDDLRDYSLCQQPAAAAWACPICLR